MHRIRCFATHTEASGLNLMHFCKEKSLKKNLINEEHLNSILRSKIYKYHTTTHNKNTNSTTKIYIKSCISAHIPLEQLMHECCGNITIRALILLQRKDIFTASLLEKLSERDVARNLTIHFILSPSDNQSDPQQLHKITVFRQEFQLIWNYIYLRVSLWEELFDMKQ